MIDRSEENDHVANVTSMVAHALCHLAISDPRNAMSMQIMPRFSQNINQ